MPVSFTLSPASGQTNASVPCVATGIGTAWTAQTGFLIAAGGAEAAIVGLTVLSPIQAVFTLQTGTQAGSLVITDTTDGVTTGFLVAGPAGAAAFSYDPTTPIGQLRLQLGDMDLSVADPTVPRDQWSCLFTDGELQYFLDKKGGDIDQATIDALRFMAARPQFLIRAIHTLNLDMEVGDLSAALNHLADELIESRAKQPAEAIAEVGVDDFSRRTIIFNRILRQGAGTQV